jgi:hypothetical protein
VAINFFLSYSRHESQFLTKSTFLDYLGPLVLSFEGQLFWDQEDHHSKWKETIRKALDEMDVFLALVSMPFLVGKWTQEETEIAIERQRKEDILVVPLMHSPAQIDGLAWLEDTHRVPKNGTYIVERNRPQCFNEIATEIKNKVIERYGAPSRSPRSDGQRRLPADDLKPVAGELRRFAQQEAERLVPDPAVRNRVIRAAETIREANGDRPLTIAQLAELDRALVSRGARKPDPKFARWVLRGKGLHPQGNYRSRE